VQRIRLVLIGQTPVAAAVAARVQAHAAYWAGREGFLVETCGPIDPGPAGDSAGSAAVESAGAGTVVLDAGAAAAGDLLVRAVRRGAAAVATVPAPLTGPLAAFHTLVADRRTRFGAALGLPVTNLVRGLTEQGQHVREVLATGTVLNSALAAAGSGSTAAVDTDEAMIAGIEELTDIAVLLSRAIGADDGRATVRVDVPEPAELVQLVRRAAADGRPVRVLADVVPGRACVRPVMLPTGSPLAVGAGMAAVSVSAAGLGLEPVVVHGRPTAAARATLAVADVLDIAREAARPWRRPRPDGGQVIPDGPDRAG
jgi:hypothetical protein